MKNRGTFWCASDFYCYFCAKTRDIDSNSQQNVEIDTVAKSKNSHIQLLPARHPQILLWLCGWLRFACSRSRLGNERTTAWHHFISGCSIQKSMWVVFFLRTAKIPWRIGESRWCNDTWWGIPCEMFLWTERLYGRAFFIIDCLLWRKTTRRDILHLPQGGFKRIANKQPLYGISHWWMKGCHLLSTW